MTFTSSVVKKMKIHKLDLGSRIEASVIQEDVLQGLPFEVQSMKQVHGDNIMMFEKYHEDEIGHDAIICNKPGVTIMVRTADCIPLVVGDPKVGIVAAIHAGWRGLMKDIIPKTLEKMFEMGSKPENIMVGIGPSLGLECSEFSDPENEIPEKFHWAIHKKKVDLNGIALKQLADLGIKKENISHMNICTKCTEGWFSFRRNGCKQRFGTIISLKNE